MQRIFNTQKITAALYIAAVLTVFIYTLCFMTEYKDLFGLKLSQNAQITFFHDSVLQRFNRQIFAFALVGVVFIGVSFLLEIFRRIPDKFALIVILSGLIIAVASSVYALSNIPAIESFYAGIDFQYINLEGGSKEYALRLTTFRIGTAVYIFNIISGVLYGIAICISHFKFLSFKKEAVKNG